MQGLPAIDLDVGEFDGPFVLNRIGNVDAFDRIDGKIAESRVVWQLRNRQSVP